jgi:hypothetical protein
LSSPAGQTLESYSEGIFFAAALKTELCRNGFYGIDRGMAHQEDRLAMTAPAREGL